MTNAIAVTNLLKLDSLLGTVTRLIEEAGVHSWAIYPTTYEGKINHGKPTICVSMIKAKDPSLFTNFNMLVEFGDCPFVKAQFSFELDTSIYDIQVRLDDAVRSMDELAKDEGFEYADSPRQHKRKPWESVL